MPQNNGHRSLKEILSPLDPKQRAYILFRICDMDVTNALKYSKTKLSSYNKWCGQEEFVAINRQVKALSGQSKDEAVKLLRGRNQAVAIVVEGVAIEKILRELASGQFNLLKTRFGNMVYTKLLADLDVNPQVTMSWAERWTNIQHEIGGRNGAITQFEADVSFPQECEEGDIVPQSEQAADETEPPG